MVELKIELLRRGLTQNAIARHFGVSRQFIYDILHSNKRMDSYRKRIVTELGLPERLVAFQPHKKKVRTAKDRVSSPPAGQL